MIWPESHTPELKTELTIYSHACQMALNESKVYFASRHFQYSLFVYMLVTYSTVTSYIHDMAARHVVPQVGVVIAAVSRIRCQRRLGRYQHCRNPLVAAKCRLITPLEKVSPKR